MTINEQHFALVDAVNNAKTKAEHWRADGRLHGFREGLRAAGVEPDLCACDIHTEPGLLDMTEAELAAARPMCCGVYLDWQPTSEPQPCP